MLRMYHSSPSSKLSLPDCRGIITPQTDVRLNTFARSVADSSRYMYNVAQKVCTSGMSDVTEYVTEYMTDSIIELESTYDHVHQTWFGSLGLHSDRRMRSCELCFFL